MTTKDKILQEVQKLAQQKLITKEELIEAYHSGVLKDIQHQDIVLTKNFRLAQFLYCLGWGLVVFGFSGFVWLNWPTFGFGQKVFATLVPALAAYIFGLLFDRYKISQTASTAFFLIFALVAPIGLTTIFDKVEFPSSDYSSQSFTYGIMFSAFLLSFFVFQKKIFLLFSIIWGTLLFFSSTKWLVLDLPRISYDLRFYTYRILVVSISYFFLGYAFSEGRYSLFSKFLYPIAAISFLGTISVLCQSLAPNSNVLGDIIYLTFVFGILFLGIRLKREEFLPVTALFLTAYLLKITIGRYIYRVKMENYPLDSVEALTYIIVAGLIIIAVGYVSFLIKKKYFPSK